MSWLDVVILALYFGILAVLSLYGIHRFYLIWLWFRTRHQRPEPGKLPAVLPRITVQLPLYNEPHLVERLIDRIAALHYPRHLLQIQILDDSTDGTTAIARRQAERLRDQGFEIDLLHRDDRAGFKAGALAAALPPATGDFIAIFDADFLPDPEFLTRTLRHFTDDRVGLVQSRWEHLNRDANLLTRVQALMLDSHFYIEHNARSRTGRFFHFNGTAGLWRKACLLDAGGWQTDTLTEDLDVSYRAQIAGWRFVFDDSIASPAELLETIPAFKSQQFRWSKGFIESAWKLLPLIWRSPLPSKVKLEAFVQLTANSVYPLMVVFSLLMFPACVIRLDPRYRWLFTLEIPFAVAATGSVLAFLAAGQLARRRNPLGELGVIPWFLALFSGLCFSNGRAVMEGLLRIRTEFVRTPKGEAERIETAAPAFSLLAWMEVGAGAYFSLLMVLCAVYGLWMTLPFLFLFQIGFLAVGMASLQQARRGRLARARASLVAPAAV